MRPRYGLVGAGFGVWGGFYLFTALPGIASGEYALAVPGLGPLVELGVQRYARNQAVATLLVFDALAQAAGVGLVIAGYSSKKRVFVADHPFVSVVPTGAGLAAVGRF